MRRQTVRCSACRHVGPSPVKQSLRRRGIDYPLLCRQCGSVAVSPIMASLRRFYTHVSLMRRLFLEMAI